ANSHDCKSVNSSNADFASADCKRALWLLQKGQNNLGGGALDTTARRYSVSVFGCLHCNGAANLFRNIAASSGKLNNPHNRTRYSIVDHGRRRHA
ncbi:MAG: hypothetical protein AB7O04_14040, partial [Hyphomonadaceae bacterium]